MDRYSETDLQQSDREELQWIRALVHQMRVEPPTRAVAAGVSYLLGGPPPRRDESPSPAEVDTLRALATRSPEHLRARAGALLEAIHVELVEDTKPSAVKPSVIRRTGPVVLERSDAPPTKARVDLLADEVMSLDLDHPDSLNRVMSLAGARLNRSGFSNFGTLIEAELVAHTPGARPDLPGYEVKTLAARPGVDRPFFVLFGKAPERLMSRRSLLENYSGNGRTLDFGKLRIGQANPKFRVEADDVALLVKTVLGEPVLSWRWDDLDERLLDKMPGLVVLILRRNGDMDAVVREVAVYANVRPQMLRRVARGRGFKIHVRLQERSGRDTFEFCVNRGALRRLYATWISVRPANG